MKVPGGRKQSQRSKRDRAAQEDGEWRRRRRRRWLEEDGDSVGKDREKDRASLSQSAGRGQQRQGLQREGHAVSQEEEKRREIHGSSSRLGGRRGDSHFIANRSLI